MIRYTSRVRRGFATLLSRIEEIGDVSNMVDHPWACHLSAPARLDVETALKYMYQESEDQARWEAAAAQKKTLDAEKKPVLRIEGRVSRQSSP